MIVALSLWVAALANISSRTEVPIKEVVLRDGTRRYAVPVSIAGHAVEAGLDSGSVGLRALPDVAAGAAHSGSDKRYSYGVGTELIGPEADAMVSIGGLAKTIPIQAVRAIGCIASHPDCPASRLSPDQFGIQGNGLPGQGFRAILGTGFAQSDVPNPLVALGAHRWIIELPLPGQRQDGRLVLNPTKEETAGFIPLALADARRDRKNDAVRSCLVKLGTNLKICAPTLIDTGAPGIEIVNEGGRDWPEGTGGQFYFPLTDGRTASIQFQSGLRQQASHLMFVRDARVQGSRLRSGLIVYLAFDVLYDADQGTIAIRPRPAYPGGPLASIN
ncbi:MAG TPA: hypothetical protein VE968_04180 [Sphingomicrobium sp.]|nr:hypothetical protein [Sphingomicrobium sp.]